MLFFFFFFASKDSGVLLFEFFKDFQLVTCFAFSVKFGKLAAWREKGILVLFGAGFVRYLTSIKGPACMVH